MSNVMKLRHQLISMPEIAELAAVQRPVVTTWRRRHASFPKPVAGDRGRPLFDVRKVVDWLVDSGRADRATIEPDVRLYQLAGIATNASLTPVVSDSRANMTPQRLVGAITALICLSYIDGGALYTGGAGRYVLAELRDRAAAVDPDDSLLRREVEFIPQSLGWLPTTVDELIEAAWNHLRAYERILGIRQRFNVPELYVDAIVPLLADLIAGLAGAGEHGNETGAVRITAVAPDAGDLAVAVLSQLREGTEASIHLLDADSYLRRIAHRRLLVHGLEPSHIRFQGATSDATVMQLPYQPIEDRHRESPLADVKACAAALTPGQTAVVLGPADLLVGGLPAYQPSLHVRNELLASGRVEAVINLPGGLMPFRPGYQNALWVLRNEDASPWQGRVLLADVANQVLTADLVDALLWDVTTWRRDGHRPQDHQRAHATQVETASLMTPRVPLITRRPTRIRDTTADPREDLVRVGEIESALRPFRTGLEVRDPARAPAQQSIGALVKRGWLTVHNGHRLSAAHVAVAGHYPVLGSSEVAGGLPVGSRKVDRGVFADAYPHGSLTEPNDVVVTLTPRLGVFLDQHGFSAVEFPARVLRISVDGRKYLRPRVLAAMLVAIGKTAGRAAGAVRGPYRLDALQVAVPSAKESERLDNVLRALGERREALQREIDMLDELRHIATSGLSAGTLTVATPTDLLS
jgi:hypothetical protein